MKPRSVICVHLEFHYVVKFETEISVGWKCTIINIRNTLSLQRGELWCIQVSELYKYPEKVMVNSWSDLIWCDILVYAHAQAWMYRFCNIRLVLLIRVRNNSDFMWVHSHIGYPTGKMRDSGDQIVLDLIRTHHWALWIFMEFGYLNYIVLLRAITKLSDGNFTIWWNSRRTAVAKFVAIPYGIILIYSAYPSRAGRGSLSLRFLDVTAFMMLAAQNYVDLKGCLLSQIYSAIIQRRKFSLKRPEWKYFSPGLAQLEQSYF